MHAQCHCCAPVVVQPDFAIATAVETVDTTAVAVDTTAAPADTTAAPAEAPAEEVKK